MGSNNARATKTRQPASNSVAFSLDPLMVSVMAPSLAAQPACHRPGVAVMPQSLHRFGRVQPDKLVVSLDLQGRVGADLADGIDAALVVDRFVAALAEILGHPDQFG